MMLWGVIAQVPYMPDELWMIILSYLCGSVCDLVAMSAVNRQLRPLARRQETTDERPIFTEQEGVREVWRQVRFGMRTSRMGCVSEDDGYGARRLDTAGGGGEGVGGDVQ